MRTKTLKRRDDNIRDHVLFELKSDPKIASSDIAVAVKDGVVTLSGFVPSYWEKDAPEKAVKRVYGVRGVANDIEVKLSSSRTDPEVARDVVRELESHISIPSEKIKVTVRNGWVTLEGSIGVEWQYQKILAESAVKKLRSDRHHQQHRGQTASFSNRSKKQDRGGAAAERRTRCPPYSRGGRRQHGETLWQRALVGRERGCRAGRMVCTRRHEGRKPNHCNPLAQIYKKTAAECPGLISASIV
jgi:osmotically-inducible protein OsmY